MQIKEKNPAISGLQLSALGLLSHVYLKKYPQFGIYFLFLLEKAQNRFC